MLKKTASFVKLAAIINTEGAYDQAIAEMTLESPESSAKEGSHRINAQKVVKYNPEFVYARFKAIGCLEVDGPNSNADAFPYGEFLDNRPGYGYQSFIGKHAFVEHASNNINNAIGDLYGAYLNRFSTEPLNHREWAQLSSDERIQVLATRPVHEDGSVEVLMAIDRKVAPRIARMIDADSPTGCSMGTNIEYSECTVCGNRAYVEEQYCPHVRFSKGQNVLVPATQINELLKKGTLRPEWLPFILSRPEDVKAVKVASRKMVYAKAFEINYGLSFFELSVVANPAFNRGYKLEKIASQIVKPSFRQLKPLVYVSGQPVEVVFNVTDEFYDDVLNAFAQQTSRPVEIWNPEERLLFDRDGEIAKAALQSGNVHEVLAGKQHAPYFVDSDIELVPSDDAGFYNIANPEELLLRTFAGTKSRKVAGAIGSKTGNFYACAECSKVFRRETHAQVDDPVIEAFDKFSICVKCEQKMSHLNTEGDSNVAKKEDVKANVDTSSKKTAEYRNKDAGGLPSTAEFTGDKDIGARKGETALYKGWAEKGSKQIEDEKTYRPMGTIFTDAIVAKKSLSDRASRLNDLKASFRTILSKVALAMDSPADFVKEMQGDKPPALPFDGTGAEDPVDKDVEGIAIAIELEPADVPTVLENTKTDLEMINKDLEQVSDMVNGAESDALDALASKLRWGKRQAYSAVKIAENADDVIDEAMSAIDDAIMKLDKACDIYRAEEDNGDGEEESTDSPVSSDKENNKEDNKPDSDSEGENKMSKGARLEITDDNVHLVQKLAGMVSGHNSSRSQGVAKTAEGAKDDEDKPGDASTEDVPDKKKDVEEKKKGEKLATSREQVKEAAAMPPTGARDPGDYGEPGAIESHEMQRWWNDMYPEYQKMKSEESRKSLNDPETKVELLTGDVGSRSGASDSAEVGKSTKAPSIYAGAVIVKKFANAWEPRKTFYGVVKLADNGSVEDAFTASFVDVAGDDGEQEQFNTFTSEAYVDEIVKQVKMAGPDATRKAMSGKKIAQLEGITPGKTSKTPQALYDTQEAEKDSNQPREGMRPDPDHGHGKEGSDDAYYGKAFGDTGYASQLKAAQAQITELRQKVADLEAEKKSQIVAKRSLHLARVASSRGVCPFDLENIQKQARGYLHLDDNGLNAVKAHLEKLPVVNQRALEAYQIPEAEEMAAGVVHNQYTSVRDVRYDNGKGEDVTPEGLQESVHNNARLSAQDQEKLRKQAQVAPQIHTNALPGASENIPDVTKHFNTIENRLKAKGKLEENRHYLHSNRRQ